MYSKRRIRFLTASTLLIWLISFLIFGALLLRFVHIQLVVIHPEQAWPLAFFISFTLLALSSASLLLARLLEREQERVGALERELQAGSAKMDRSQRTLDTLLGQADSTVLIFDASGNTAYVNPAHERILGYSPEDYQEDPELGDRIVLPEDREKRAEYFDKISRLEAPPDPVTIRYRNRSGDLVYLEYRASTILSRIGETIGVLVVGRDITTEREAEEALRRSRYELSIHNRLAEIFLTVPDEEVYGEALQLILEATESAYGIFGYVEEDGSLVSPSLSRKVWDQCQIPAKSVVFPREQWAGIWGNALLDKKTYYSNEPFSVPEGHIPIERAVAVPLVHQGEAIGLLMVGNKATDYEEKDIALLESVASYKAPILRARLERDRRDSERKRAEEALRESEKRYRTLFEGAAEGILVADVETRRFKYANTAICKMLGYTKEELESMSVEDIHPAEVLEHVISEFGAQARGEKNLNPDVPVVRKDGTTLRADIKTALVEIDGRKCNVGFFTDISERKHLEDQLRQAQRLESIGRLAGGVAHDFNNLLTAINGYSDLLLDRLEEGSPLREDLQVIRDAGERAAALTHQLLAFSRKQVLEPKVLDLNSVVARVERMLRRVIGEDVDLVTVPAPELGSVEVDPTQIEQIILNLAVNARDAMPGGGKLTIETANVELDEEYAKQHVGVTPGAYVMLAVSDTGVGMDAETQRRIFDPFFTTKKKGEGTGLGLSTVYGIVKQSGGNIWVYSELGQGTTFKVYLPRVDRPADSVSVQRASADSMHGSESILIVEDEASVRKLAREILEQHGYKVLDAYSGREALSLAGRHRHPIHLMVTDVVLPDMHGPELVKRLSSLRPDMRVLYCSGYTDNAIVHHGVLDSETAFLQKPFTPQSLLRKVREVLGGARAG